MEQVMLKFVRLSDRAFLPSWGSPEAVGLDLLSAYQYVIPPFTTIKIETDLALESFPPECYGRIAPRSGLALRGINVNAGVIDPDYRGPIGVVLYNQTPNQTFIIKPGDKIAQLICEKALFPQSVQIKWSNGGLGIVIDRQSSVATPHRGISGFGSTGV